MKKFLTLLLVFSLAAGLLCGCGGEIQSQPQQVIKIGMLEPFTGANSAGGKQEALGIAYANMVQPTVEIGGVTYQVELAIADDESSREKAPTAAQSLVDNGVCVVLGSYGSDEALAASDVLKQAGIPAVGVTCTNPAITAGNEHYFRICWLDTFQGSVLADFATDHMNLKKVYCLAEQDDNYSAGLCSYFIEAFTAQGGEVVYESFPAGTTDFTPYLKTAVREEAQAIFAPISVEPAAWMLANAGDETITVPFLAGDSWDSNVIAASAKNEKVNVYITTFFDENVENDSAKTFVKGFQEFINSDPTIERYNGGNDMVSANSAMGYDAYFTVLEAMKIAGSTDPAAIQEALNSVDFTGVTGRIVFEAETGNAIRDTAYIKQVNSEFGTWDFVTVESLAD